MRLYVSRLLLVLVTAVLVPISASAQSNDRCLAVYDANGTRIGSANQSVNTTTLLINQNGVPVRLTVNGSVLRGNVNLLFTDQNCDGDAYIPFDGQIQPPAQLEEFGTDIWYPDTFAPLMQQFNLASVRNSEGECSNNFIAENVYPALTMPIPAHTFPLHLEFEACFTPPPMVAALTPYGLGAMVLVLAFGAYLMMQRPRVA